MVLPNNPSSKREQEIQAFLKILDISGLDKELIEISLMHPSYLYESNIDREKKDLQEKEYRRLAHLGDAIIGAIITDYLYEQYPKLAKGELTQVKQLLVDKVQLSEFAEQLSLDKFCLLGKSLQGKSISEQENLFAEMFEAAFGAIYLGLKRDFSSSKSWLIERFIMEVADEILFDDNETDDNLDEFYSDEFVVTTRQYLDMIGSFDFPNYGWAPGDDD
ncbi:ribonuclease III (plasmid) [Calothrix sp. NIES-4071]|nr:ribonuclease III [Calothrix sp. NIES-4071]BAZ64931.1 ribonuclease III [Calothrix sp. NIES-4105]